MNDDFLTTESVAALLHVTPETVRAMAARGAMPRAKTGKRWLFPRAEFLAWMSSRTLGVATKRPVRPATNEAPRKPARLEEGTGMVIFPNASWRTEDELAARRESAR